MRGIVLVALLLATLVPSCTPSNCILRRDLSGEYEEVINLDAKTVLPKSLIEENEVFFYYSSFIHFYPIKFFLDEAAYVLGKTDFNASRPTYLTVHGWRNNHESKLNQLVGPAILSKCYDCNLIVTDWSAGALDLNYMVSRVDVPAVGLAVASIVKELGLDTNVLTIIGHSLGAHAAGIAGADLSQSLGPPAQIVGLDPALPLFDLTSKSGRLDPSDGKIVHVIHTCAGLLGFVDPIGHADFYPGEGGIAQPGCVDTFCICNHDRSFEYYAESIRTGGFTATFCDSYENFITGMCDNNPSSHMGGLLLDDKANGTYFLDVSDSEPYSLF